MGTKKWESDGQSKTINAKDGNKIQTNIEDLQPGTTYTVRLKIATDGQSTASVKASPELIIDTEAVGCTPKGSQCLIL